MRQRDAIDAEHAFYLGYEMAKAVTATLGKNYTPQDPGRHWQGFLKRDTGRDSHAGRGMAGNDG